MPAMRTLVGRFAHPWPIAFGLSVLAVISSFIYLAAALAETRSSGSPSQGIPTTPFQTQQPGKDTPALLRYSGPLPARLDPSAFASVNAGGDADLRFVPGSEGTAVRYWVPVASMAAAIDALSRAELAALLMPPPAVAAGGECPGHPAPAVLTASLGVVTVPPTAAGAQRFESVDALLAAMAERDACLVAFIPLEAMRPDVMAVAVDGADLVRGRGDAANWPFAERVAVEAATGRGRAVLADVRSVMEAPIAKPVTVVATGDILMSRCALTRIQATGDWAAALRGPMAEYLAAADLALGSLDGSIQDVNPSWGCVETTNLSSPPEVMEALTLAGFDEMTVATNHVFDCGQDFCGTQAFRQTLDRLHQAGIKTVGGGLNLEEALAPAIFDVNGLRVGVLGFDDVAAMDLEATDTAPGTAPLDDDYAEERRAGEPAFYRPAADLGLTRFKERIAKLKAEVDVVVVQVQSGTEDTHDPSPRSIKAMRAAVDAGADLVVGNQAHHVQAIETRPDAFIAYALGNFIFDQTHTPEHTQGFLLEATFREKRLVAVRFRPYQIEDKYKPVFATGALRTKILGDVMEASSKLAACESATLCPK